MSHRRCERREAGRFLARQGGLLRRPWFLAMTVLIAALAFNLSACGEKGKLKSPSMIAREEAKQQKKKAAGNADSPASPASPDSPASPAGSQ
ncbi:MAG: hypothetical protein KGI29_00550 [Pseudomonadota bacterium]|nr:hypothetical protein [Pseudomonadota bacterium]MDE3038854.1 hypothetical protein [Pseudomonadota bacterium]